MSGRVRRREVYVRGVGAITALGATWPESVPRLAAGDAAVRPVTAFDVTGFPSRVAAAIPDEVAGALEPRDDRRRALAERAAAEAWAEADLGDVDRRRLGVFIGAESGRAPLAAVLAMARAGGGGARLDHVAFARNARELARSFDAAVASPATVASALAARYGAEGPCVTISIACSSGAAAVVEATRALRLGEVDVALAGGVGADVDPLMLAGFGKLSALSEVGVSRPFDVRRDGFVVGEGAAMVVLAVERGAARARIAGIARSLDAHHLTAPDPEGRGAEQAMRDALADAGLDPARSPSDGAPSLGYVQAHGTSTPLNDAVEAAALRRVLGDRAASIPVSSVKGALGHWVAGAGALGLLCALEAITAGIALPTAGLEQIDPACALDHVVGTARAVDAEAALVTSFAFGGANSAIVVARADGAEARSP